MGDKLVRGTEHRRIALEGAAVEGGVPSRVGAGNAGVAGETAAADGEGSAYPAAFHPQGLAGLGDPREAENSLASLVVGDLHPVPGGFRGGIGRQEPDGIRLGAYRLYLTANDQCRIVLEEDLGSGFQGQHETREKDHVARDR